MAINADCDDRGQELYVDGSRLERDTDTREFVDYFEGSRGSAGGGTVTTYLMRGWGTVSLRHLYWIASAPDGSGAPEVVTDPVLMKEIH